MREYAEIERQGWLQELEAEYKIRETQCYASTPENDLAFRLSDNAVFGSLSLHRAFWENKLKLILEKSRAKFSLSAAMSGGCLRQHGQTDSR
ncbi:MAG: hypothetical protein GY850_07330 [bacterium]|nr:hypothetical protein [bacterium]